MRDRYCPYHQGFVPDVGFKVVRHPSSGTQRQMCPMCQEKRKKPRATLQALADRDRAERRAADQKRAREANERTRQCEP